MGSRTTNSHEFPRISPSCNRLKSNQRNICPDSCHSCYSWFTLTATSRRDPEPRIRTDFHESSPIAIVRNQVSETNVLIRVIRAIRGQTHSYVAAGSRTTDSHGFPRISPCGDRPKSSQRNKCPDSCHSCYSWSNSLQRRDGVQNHEFTPISTNNRQLRSSEIKPAKQMS